MRTKSKWHAFQRAVAIALIPAIAGCQSMINPHVWDPGLLDQTSRERTIHFAGDVEAAIDDVNVQRRRYFEAVGDHAVFRNKTALFLIPLTAAMVYKGLTTDSVSARRNLALGGATLGAGYGMFNWFTNREGEAAYLAGYRSITCAVWRVRPFLIPTEDYDKWLLDVVALEPLVRQLDRLENKMEVELSRYQELGETNKFIRHVKSDLRDARRARIAGEKKLKQSAMLKGRVETTGFVLRKRVDLIVTSVSEAIQRSEPQIDQLKGLVNSIASQVAANVEALRPDTLNLRDEKEFDTPAEPDAKGPKVEPPVAPAVAAADPTVSAQLNAAIKSVADLKTKQATIKAEGDKGRKAAEAALKKLEARVDALKKRLDAVRAPTMEEAVNDVRERAIAQRRDLLERGLADQSIRLVDLKARVYQARNKVDAMFERVYKVALSTRDAEQCRASGTPALAVTPADDQVLALGGVLNFTITGGEGIPRVHLAGNNGGDADNEVKLTVTVVAGVLNAAVKADKKLPAGPLLLVVIDGTGKQREEITITMKASLASKPETPP